MSEYISHFSSWTLSKMNWKMTDSWQMQDFSLRCHTENSTPPPILSMRIGKYLAYGSRGQPVELANHPHVAYRSKMNGATHSINHIFMWNTGGNSIFTFTIWKVYADPKSYISFKNNVSWLFVLWQFPSNDHSVNILYLLCSSVADDRPNIPRATWLSTCLPTYTRTYLPN